MSCFGMESGRCRVLRTKECWGSACPFYKTQAQLEEERRVVLDYLRVSGRHDLIDKYHASGDSVVRRVGMPSVAG